MLPAVLAATWQDGLFVLTEKALEHELAGHSVRGLTTDGRGGALAIVDGDTLRRRSAAGQWRVLAAAADLSCCVASGDAVYVGTDTARVFRIDADQNLAEVPGFGRVKGRETWTAGQALVDGKLVGPPLGVRSISAAPDGTLLANVHVGGIPRSTDGGITWHPTIDVERDVHEVRAHPSRPGVVMAAAAAGLCSSRDGGATWTVQYEGLHARYCSAVAFVGDDVWVAASDSHFASQGRVYRRRVAEDGPLSAVLGDLPEWTDGIVDTNCIAASGSRVALADRAGNVYLSSNAGLNWSRAADRLPALSGILVA
ncbi:MAG TPA: hypothetical protein VNW92_22630 [Polyangiaceae bacterium]|jgi:hypothetical protein|nr:hypothetical protein [Polyangiaceae bacterium]